MKQNALERQISAALLRMHERTPFFSVLSRFATFRPSLEVPRDATDGHIVYYNPEFLGTLRPRELAELLLHQVLHAALLHPLRRDRREAERWNVAADVVVHGILAGQSSLQLSRGAIRDAACERLPVEEIYKSRKADNPGGCPPCLLLAPGEREDMEFAMIGAHWMEAMRQAKAAARGAGKPNPLAGVDGHLDEIAGLIIDGLEIHQDEQRAALFVYRPEPESESERFGWPLFHSWEVASQMHARGLVIDRAVCAGLRSLDDILEGQGDGRDFPEEPSLRYTLTMGLTVRARSAEHALAAFRWLSARAAPEWVHLLVSNLIGRLRAAGHVPAFAKLVQADLELRVFLHDYLELCGLGRASMTSLGFDKNGIEHLRYEPQVRP